MKDSREESAIWALKTLVNPDDGPVTCFLICQKSVSRKEESVSGKEASVSRYEKSVPRTQGRPAHFRVQSLGCEFWYWKLG